MFFRILIFFTALTIMSCGSPVSAEVKANDHPFELGTFPVFKAGENGIFLAYYGKGAENSLYIKRIGDAGETEIKARNMKGTYIVLSFLKDNIFLTWRPKDGEGEKYIYVQRSDDKAKTFKEPVILNTTTDALPPIGAVTDGKDRLYVAWVDERESDHRLYMNYSLNGGRDFLPRDVLLTPDFSGTNQPRLLLKDNRVDLFFTGKKKEDKSGGIYNIYSEDGGKTWSQPNTVEPDMGWSPFTIVPIRTGNRMLIFWAGVEGFHGAWSKDGKKWGKVSFKETEGKDVYRLSVIPLGETVYISTSWVTRLAVDEKPNVYFYKSEDAGMTWTGPKKINTNKYNTTSSTFPDIGLSRDGKTILVAWQDHRDIRGSIYINYSKDGGKTWLKEDIAIGKEPGKYNSANPYIVEHKGKFYVLWLRFKDDLKAEADLFMEEVTIK